MNTYDVAELAQTLFEEAGDALFLFDPETEQVLDVNPMGQRLTGQTRRQIAQLQITYLFRAEHANGLQRLRNAFRKTGLFHAQSGFLLRQQQSGHWLPVNLTITRLHTDAGTLGLITARDMSEQRETERLIKKKETQLRRVLDSVSDCLWSADIDARGRWTLGYCSPVVQRITGRPPEHFQGGVERWFGIVHEADRPHVVDGFQRLRAGLTSIEHDYRIRRPDGAIAWVRGSVQTFREEDGRLRLDGVITDITERMQIEDRLRQSEKKYRDLVETSNDLIWSVDVEGRWTFVNRNAARAIYGYEPEEMLGKRFVEFLPEEIRERDQAVFQRIKDGVPAFSHETTHLRKDGTPVRLSFNAIVLRDEAGAVLGTTGTAADVTKRLEAERSYRCLIENLDQCIFLKDSELRFVAANRNFCRGLGLDEAELLGKTDRDFYPPELVDKYRADDLIVLREGRAVQAEEENIQNGRRIRVRTHKTPVKDDQGRMVGVLGIFWDVTQQAAQEEQLRHMQKMEAIGLLAGGVAHDFNNLLTVILGNISFILSRSVDVDTLRELLGNAEKAGLRAAELTRRLLNFSRRVPLRSEPVDLRHALDEAVHFLRPTIDPRIEIVVGGATPPWQVLADPGQLNQVLINLAVNARDAMPDGGQLIFETAHFTPDDAYLRTHLEARPGEFVRLRVCDTGCGMSPEVRARIFEPFFTTKEMGKGTGLGLANVFGIIKQHQGWIECASEPGKGTTFDVFLPRCAADARARTPSAAVSISGSGTILLVDDEAMIRTLGETVLRRFGYEVLLAEDGRHAVELYAARHQSIDLVILDGSMPRLSGRDALKAMSQINPGVKVIFSSGFAAEHLDLGSFHEVVDFLHKPYRVEDLALKVRDTLARLQAAE